jgi:hypothetical protein
LRFPSRPPARCPTSRDMQKVEQAEDAFAQVYKWRRRVLREAGYDRRNADLLASQLDVDLHKAVKMIEEGCEQRLALKILL